MEKRGRKKGSTSYVELSYEELGEYVGRRGIVRLSKAWLESTGWEPAHQNNDNCGVREEDEGKGDSSPPRPTLPPNEIVTEADDKVTVVREKLS